MAKTKRKGIGDDLPVRFATVAVLAAILVAVVQFALASRQSKTVVEAVGYGTP